MNREQMAAQAAAIQWWHGGMDLGYGVITQGQSNPARDLLPLIELPSNLRGKSVLDVGTWDGYMAFECERRNAAKVVAVDSFVWSRERIKAVRGATGRAGFDLAHTALHSQVEAVECEVLDLDPAKLGTFDVVLFLGVLYHMRHPLLALERVAAMTKDLLIVETYVRTFDPHVPTMRFYPTNELNGDPSNWWGPNVEAVIAMLQAVGFDDVRFVARNGSRAAFHAQRSAR